jgi:hypothetical protein
MALNNNDQARIREYLLGRLGDEEQEKIEERLMVDDELFEELEISKGELIEEYSAGELSQTERESFESRYLISPEARQRHTFSRALDRLGQHKQPTPLPVPRTISLFDQIRAFFNWQRMAFAAGSAALVLTVATSLFLRRPPVFVSVDLTSNAANRAPGARQYHPITQNPNIDEVRFTLQVPQSATPRTGYVVELDNQTDTTTFTPLAQNQTSVVVAIPANKLPPGIYALRLQVELPDGTTQREPWEYYFEVTK